MKAILNGVLLATLTLAASPSYSGVLGLSMGDKPGNDCKLNSKNECQATPDRDPLFKEAVGVYGEKSGLCVVHLTSRHMTGDEKAAIYTALNKSIRMEYNRPVKDDKKDVGSHYVGESEWKIKPNPEEHVRKIELYTSSFDDKDGNIFMSVYFENSEDAGGNKVKCS